MIKDKFENKLGSLADHRQFLCQSFATTNIEKFK